MANLKRYDVVGYDPDTQETCYEVEDEDGEYVKFEDIKEYLPSASDNKQSFQSLCKSCEYKTSCQEDKWDDDDFIVSKCGTYDKE